MDQSEDDHTHCDSCIRRNCHDGCVMTACDQFCGAVFHACKQSEHELLCPLVRVPCINKQNGCPHIMPRHRQGIHLMTCPASVICCTNEWNRRPVVDKQNCVSSHLLVSDQLQTEELDVALMLRDQRFLNMALEQNNNKQLSVVSLATPYCSNQVIRHSNIISLSKQFLSSVPPPGLQRSICEQLFGTSSENQNGSKNCDNNRSVASHNPVPGLNQHCCNDVYNGTATSVDGGGEQVSLSEDIPHVFPRLNAVAEEHSANSSSPVVPTSEMHLSSMKPNSEMSDDIRHSTSQTGINPNEQGCAAASSVSLPVLCLDLTIDSLTRYQPKQDSIFTFMCAQVFRRDQYAAHVKNIHSEIYAGLNGWLVQRCPLACYGCPFSVRRMYPNNEHSKVVYSTVVESFGIQPSIDESVSQQDNCQSKDKHFPLLVELPTEVLEHIARFLDGFSLNNLALTCRLLRDVCYNILPDKGIVVEEWQSIQIGNRRHWYPACYKWRFSVASSPIDNWTLTCFGMISTHLKHCAFYRCWPQAAEQVWLPGLDENFLAFKNNFHLVNRAVYLKVEYHEDFFVILTFFGENPPSQQKHVVWLFTNSTTSVESWGLNQDVFKITDHLTTCKFNDRLKRDAPYRIITAEEHEIIQP